MVGKIGRSKLLWSVGCLLLGGLLFFLGVQRMRSALLLLEGNLAVAQKQFESQAYEQAAQIWWTRDDHVLFNQGVRAFWAQDLRQAVQLFRKVSQTTADRGLHSKALYNSGVILMEMQQPEHAAELFKQALRLDPANRDAKFNLEQLYRLAQLKEGQSSAVSLDQLPLQPKDPHTSSDKGVESDQGVRQPGI